MKAQVHPGWCRSFPSILIGAALVVLLSLPSYAEIYGVKTLRPYGPSTSNIPSSWPPAALFSFNEDGTGLTYLGDVMVDGLRVDVDGLAISKSQGLLGFELIHSQADPRQIISSWLLQIDRSTAIAVRLFEYPDTEIRGAAFGPGDILVAIDAKHNKVLTIDPNSGVISRSADLARHVSEPIHNADVAVDAEGNYTIVINEATDPWTGGPCYYRLNPENGDMSEIYEDGIWHIGGNPRSDVNVHIMGITFSGDTDPKTLFALDGNGYEEIFTYELPDWTRNCVIGYIWPLHPVTGAFFNSGCGDLAAIVDFNQPPVISPLAVDRPLLWPPNHQMVDIALLYAVSDDADPASDLHCAISISSNEPETGAGTGNFAPDFEVVDAHHVRLRAERSGSGSGRIYTITVCITDSGGLSSESTITVFVPPSQ